MPSEGSIHDLLLSTYDFQITDAFIRYNFVCEVANFSIVIATSLGFPGRREFAVRPDAGASLRHFSPGPAELGQGFDGLRDKAVEP